MGRPKNETQWTEYIAMYLEKKGIRTYAARELGIPYPTVRKWFKDPKFLEQLAEVQDEFNDLVIQGLRNRAETKSDTAAFGYLKAMDPEKWDDNIRKAKWLKEHGMTDPDAQVPQQVILIREPEPERIKVIDGQPGTNGDGPH